MELETIGSLRQALGALDSDQSIVPIPTGVHNLDSLIGGGFPNGRVISVIGKGGVGKSTLLYSYMNNVCKLGGIAALIDTDVSYTESRVRELGYDLLADQILLLRDVPIDDFLNYFNKFLATIASAPNYKFGCLVIDTFSNMISKAEMNSGNPGVGIHARHSSLFFRNALSYMSKYNVTVVFICHEKNKIMTMPGFGGRGGYGYIAQNAIYANSFLEVRMTRVQGIKQGASTVGFKVKADVKKNKIAPPFREVELDYFFHCGFDRASSLLAALIQAGIATKSGAWYDVRGERFQVKDLRSHPHLIETFEGILYESLSEPMCDVAVDVQLDTQDEEIQTAEEVLDDNEESVDGD
jgi:recombination protein RecA